RQGRAAGGSGGRTGRADGATARRRGSPDKRAHLIARAAGERRAPLALRLSRRRKHLPASAHPGSRLPHPAPRPPAPHPAHAPLAIRGSAVSTHAALLAHHFEEGGEHLEAARWHEHAGRRVARSDPAEGARHCRKVTELLVTVPESRDTLTLELTSRIALLEI